MRTLLLLPAEYCNPDEFSAVVADNQFRLVSVCDDPIKLPNDQLARQGCVSDAANAFPGAHVGDSQDPQPSLTKRTADDHRQPPARYGAMGARFAGVWLPSSCYPTWGDTTLLVMPFPQI